MNILKTRELIYWLIALSILVVVPGNAQQPGATARPTPTPQPQTRTPANPAPTPAPLNINIVASEREIDSSIADDPAVNAMLAPYSAKVRALGAPIGKLSAELRKGGVGAGSLGNFVADAMRSRAQLKLGKPVLLAVTNSGGLRKNQIAAGDLSSTDIFELLPFENALIALDLKGTQLKSFLNVIVGHRDAQSGAWITYRTNEKNENELVNVMLGEGPPTSAIDPNATYTIVTIDYLLKRGGDYNILKEAANVRPLNLTIRDAVLDYVKAETAAGRAINATLDGRFRQDKPNPNTTGGEQPQ